MKNSKSIDKNALFKAILSLKSTDECAKFLRDLLTEKEIIEFTQRWKVAQMLDLGVPYETIEKETAMSSTTIARISKWLVNGMGGYRLVLDRLNKNMKQKNNLNIKNNHHSSSTAG